MPLVQKFSGKTANDLFITLKQSMRNKIILIVSFLAGIFLLNSCLKDKVGDYWKDDLAGKMYATIASPGLQTKSLLPISDEVTFGFLVNIATDALPTNDITLALALDNGAISAYDSTLRAAAIANKDTLEDGKLKWKNYKPFPSVQLLDPTVTIKAGTRNAYVRVKIARADTVKLTGNYMTAISLISVTPSDIPIAGNMKTVLFAFPLANEYEGDYSSEGFRDHPANGIEPFKYGKVTFSTVNGNTVHKTQVGNYTGYGLDITVTTETMVVNGVSVNKCNLVITGMSDPTDYIIYSTYNGEPMNFYNPVTKVFELYYGYNKAAPRKLRETDSRL
jgi:hypothetical protein